MKIIENPNPVEEKRLTCNTCKCKFTYNNSDIHRDSWNNGIIGPGFSGYSREYVICPNCGTSIYITDESTSSTLSETIVIDNLLQDPDIINSLIDYR